MVRPHLWLPCVLAALVLAASVPSCSAADGESCGTDPAMASSDPIPAACGDCVELVCQAMPSCCTTEWTAACADTYNGRVRSGSCEPSACTESDVREASSCESGQEVCASGSWTCTDPQPAGCDGHQTLETWCEGGVLYQCSGNEATLIEDCAASSLECSPEGCFEACTADERRCIEDDANGDYVEVCDATEGWQHAEDCENGCDDNGMDCGAPECKTGLCTPGDECCDPEEECYPIPGLEYECMKEPYEPPLLP